jgi:hypothetical protein
MGSSGGWRGFAKGWLWCAANRWGEHDICCLSNLCCALSMFVGILSWLAVCGVLNGSWVPPEAGGDLLRDGPGVLPTGAHRYAASASCFVHCGCLLLTCCIVVRWMALGCHLRLRVTC